MATSENRQPPEGQKLHGLVVEFDNVDDLLDACVQVRDQGYTKWDSHTPFPVHGIDEAMGIRPTILPWIVLGAGLTGLLTALLLQWWTNAIDYPFLISGKPYFSLPANIPIIFELTVLFSALAAFSAALILNRLPQLHHPLFGNERFKQVTDDRFFLAIEASDPAFHAEGTRKLLEVQQVSSPVEEVYCEALPAPVPKVLFVGLMAGAVLALIPLAFAVRARFNTSENPRVHIVWDMDWQKKYKTQSASPWFEDGRAMRPQIAGTLARGDLIEDADLPFQTGKTADGQWVTDFPLQRGELTEAFMTRGQERFGIFCAPCHGHDGSGRGAVTVRAEQLRESAFLPPTDYHTDIIREQPVGQIFDSVTNGVRTMPAYGSQIRPADRWAIILYLRALQRSRNGTLADVPAEQQGALKDG